MKKMLALALALVLTACGQQASSDGYTFDKQEYSKNQIEVVFVDYPDVRAFERAAAEKTNGTEGVLAFSAISPNSNKCTIHMVSSSVQYSPELIGHEITHCRYGRFH